LKAPGELPEVDDSGRDEYLERYVRAFGPDRLAGKKVVFYQHSAVGRDILVELFGRLGAEVAPVGRSEVFVPIDSENVTAQYQAYFKELAAEHPDAFAIISTDGDSDRPFVVDASGAFHRGDVLGAVVAQWLKAEAAALPVSASDAATQWLDQHGIAWAYTKIGSPYVVEAMEAQLAAGKGSAVGWEVNGGFLTGSDVAVGGQVLGALPTRDAALPIIVALVAAAEAGKRVAELFGELPKRFTQAGLVDDFPMEVSRRIVAGDMAEVFVAEDGFGRIRDVNDLDGMRVFFENGEIAHIRPSGNAPQLRAYSVADSQERADEIVAATLKRVLTFK
jgi:phosphomannomutase